MKLRLSVTTGQPAFSNHRESHEFTELGGTIGRAGHNDWVIPDPTRVVSGTHAQIDFVDGQFQLTDTSTNGVYVNGSDLALGRDNRIPLASGDRFQIGDFEIAVTVEDDSAEREPAEQVETGLPPWPIDESGDAPTPVLPEDFGQQPSYWGGTQPDQVPDVYGNLADLGSIGTGVEGTTSSSAEWDFSDLDPNAGGMPVDRDQADTDRLPDGTWPDSAAGAEAPDQPEPIEDKAGALSNRSVGKLPADTGAGAGSDEIQAGAASMDREKADRTGRRAPSGPRGSAADSPLKIPNSWPEAEAEALAAGEDSHGPGYDVGALEQPEASYSESHPQEPPQKLLPDEDQRESSGSEPLDLELPDLREPDVTPATPLRPASVGFRSAPGLADDGHDSDATAAYRADQLAAAQSDQEPGYQQSRGAGPSRPTTPSHGPMPPAGPPAQPSTQRGAQPPPAGEASGLNSGQEATEAALAAFLQGAGVPGLHVPHGASPETFRAIGELLALYAGGSAELLRLIGNIKNTFRIDQTQIRQRDNNPLRWVASPREAVRRLLAPEDDGYLAPKEAVSDALASIKAHQMGSIHGMQEAFKAFLSELEPRELESGFDRQGRPGPLTNKAAWYWARYADYHRRLLEDAQNNVLDLIGTAFSTAYEQQVQSMRKQHKGRG